MQHLDDLGEPQRVYIVGAGSMGANFYSKIPKDAYTIAVNRMIAYPREWTVWMAFDINAPRQPWWNSKVPAGTTAILCANLAEKHPQCDYVFYSGRPLPCKGIPLSADGLRGGGTISACALQLAWFMGVDHITLVGVDMTGQYHYDGSKANSRPGRWMQCFRFQYLIDTMRSRGARIDSLSPTALKVPVVKE
jgi:hypothetical protein